MIWRCCFMLICFPILSVNCIEPEQERVCDKRPSGTETSKTKADGRFKITVVGAVDKKYLPDNNYTVQLKSKGNSAFTSFLIMADGDLIHDKANIRNVYYLLPGTLKPKSDSLVPTQMHPTCDNVVQQSDNSPKTMVEIEWIAPPKGQACVTIHAMVAESRDVWYMDDGPLTYKICEDTRKIIDIDPRPIQQCGACEEAKYQLTFEGQWSRNTHPHNFPDSANLRFSDLVGASHSSNYYLWDYNVKATPGLKLLAEAANTTLLEQEIQNKLDSGVRTLIKASGHYGEHLSKPTSAIFRANSVYHLISFATSIVPSPDWFLGVRHFELCFENNTWVKDRELNLYLIDAGTDNGVSYESSNEETLPPGLIKRIRERSDNRKSPFYSTIPGTPRHFAKMRVQLLRVYRETCSAGSNEKQNTSDESQNGEEGTTTESIAITPTDFLGTNLSNQECPLTEWDDWQECTPKCGPIRQTFRMRYHIVNAVVIKYDPENTQRLPKVPERCKNVQLIDAKYCDPTQCG